MWVVGPWRIAYGCQTSESKLAVPRLSLEGRQSDMAKGANGTYLVATTAAEAADAGTAVGLAGAITTALEFPPSAPPCAP